MFDFIEEPLSPRKEESSGEKETTSRLDGSVYTMPKKVASVTTPVTSQPASTTQSDSRTSGGPSKKMYGIVAGVVLLLLLITGGFLWYSFSQVTPVVVQQDSVLPPDSSLSDVAGLPMDEDVDLSGQETEELEDDDIDSDDAIIPVSPSGSIEYVQGVDSDRDGLTDLEETKLFLTDPSLPDTDNDGFIDGQEVTFLYDPTRVTPAKLETSEFATLYSNPTHSYALLYPTAWLANSSDRLRREVVFTASTGEHITVTVQDNPQMLDALEWYTTVKQPGVDTSTLQTMTYDTWSGVMSDSGLEVYITSKDSQGQVVTPLVYMIEYNFAASSQEMNFPAVFQMLIRSFLITELSFVN